MIMMRRFFILATAALLTLGAQAQRIQQKLGRGVVATMRGSSGLVSWRKLAQEPEDMSYNLYKNGSLLTTTTKTNYTISSVNDGDVFRVVPVLNGTEQTSGEGSFTYKANSSYNNQFMEITFDATTCPVDSFDAKYVWPADLDGDGEYDYIVAQISRNFPTTTCKVQAYKSDGTFLWCIDMGPNVYICSGQNDMVVAYDIDCDGKAEVIVRSSDGTRFWDSSAGTYGLYPMKSTTADVDGDGISNYLSRTDKNPPFYISVIDGLTGEEKVSAELDYSKITDGVNKYSRTNRSQYMTDTYGTEYAFFGGHFAITYDDGIHPTVAMKNLVRTTDGTHHDYVVHFGYDWNNGVPSNFHHSYTWARNNKTPWPAEFHGNRVCDVDGDGIDEIIPGAFAVNSSKGMVASPGIGHGDRFRISDINPNRPGLEEYAIQQSNLLGQIIFDPATGEHIKEWYLSTVYDVGRGECMDVDSTYKGYEIYSLESDNMYNCEGDVIASSHLYPYEGVWWAGNLLRQSLASPGGSGYKSNAMIIDAKSGSRLAQFSSESSWAIHAGWAVRPAFFGDIIGDWREEVVLLKNPGGQNIGLVGYTTNYATDYSMYCLQEDPHYRLDCTCRGYYQSPNTGFYLGYDMPYPPLPAVMTADLRWKSGSSWEAGTFTTFDQTATQSYADGKSVIFDISGDTTATIQLTGTVSPATTYLMVPKEHTYTFAGNGNIGGTGEIWKSERGTAVMDVNFTTTGKTVISDGTLVLNGTISGPLSLRAKGTLAGNTTINGDVEIEGALNYEGGRLSPGTADAVGTMTFGKSLNVNNDLFVEANVGNGSCDKITVNGDLTVSDTLTFTIIPTSTENSDLKGDYVLMEATGTLTADASIFKVRELEGQPYTVKVEGNQVILSIPETRAAADVTWTGAVDSNWDYQTNNFKDAAGETYFVQYDNVTFNDEAAIKNVTLNSKMIQNSVTFNNNEDYTLTGDGGISGTGNLVKEGNGELVLNLKNSDYTGATIINGGTLTVEDMTSLGNASTDAENFQINGGELKITGLNVSTEKKMTLSDTATITITKAKGFLSLNNPITASEAVLVKDGPGQLNFNYPGTYSLKALVMKDGTLAQGSRSATFGTAPVYVTGTTPIIQLIANSSMSNVPNYQHPTEIADSAKLTIKGVERAYLNGSFSGKGDLELQTGGVRMDIISDFSNFEGTLYLNGASRLSTSVTDMKKLTLTLGDASSVRHYKTGSGDGTTATLQVGALANASGVSYSTLPTFGGSDESWEVGYNNEDASFKGSLTTKKTTKVGTGTWSLTGTESTSSIDVKGGTLYFLNFGSSKKLTTGTVSVYDGATLRGYGTTNSIVAYQGATITSGMNDEGVGTIKTSGNFIATNATLLVKCTSSTSYDKFQVGGTLRFNTSDTIRIQPLEGCTFSEGDEITIFTKGKPTEAMVALLTIDGGGYEWDTQYLASDGKLVCLGVSTGITGIKALGGKAKVYTTSGIFVKEIQTGNIKEELNELPAGVYVIGGRKIVKN